MNISNSDGLLKYSVINLPGGEKFITDFNTMDIYNVVSDFCGEDFAAGVLEAIEELQAQADYETLKFNSDMEAYEAENEDFRNTLQEIESLLQQYEYKIERGQRFTRADVFKLFNEIHKLIGDVI